MSATDLDLARQLFPTVEPFLKTDGEKAAELFNLTGRRARSLADCQIAAVALRCNARIATSDRNDFKLFEEHGLNLI
jgi:predicted nucleic acid-binding protein